MRGVSWLWPIWLALELSLGTISFTADFPENRLLLLCTVYGTAMARTGQQLNLAIGAALAFL